MGDLGCSQPDWSWDFAALALYGGLGGAAVGSTQGWGGAVGGGFLGAVAGMALVSAAKWYNALQWESSDAGIREPLDLLFHRPGEALEGRLELTEDRVCILAGLHHVPRFRHNLWRHHTHFREPQCGLTNRLPALQGREHAALNDDVEVV